MRYFLLSSLVLLLFSCASSRVSEISLEDRKAITIFTDTTSAYLYKSKIDLYGHYLSGIMMIKPVGNYNYKVAVTTEFGAKIMDFELTNGKFILHDCIPDMKRKRILKVVEEDMKMLLGVVKPSLVLYYKNPLVYKSGYVYVYQVLGVNQVTRIFDYSVQKDERDVDINLSEHQGEIPGKITVHHTKMPMQIELQRLNTTDAAE